VVAYDDDGSNGAPEVAGVHVFPPSVLVAESNARTSVEA
jgi:hypothetical protein